jgi:hypothetical protein
MQSKLLAACFMLAAFAALAMPTLALALTSPLVVENGTAVAVGTKVEGVNVGNIKMTTSLGTIECSTAIVTGELIKNTTGAVEATISSAKIGGTGPLQTGASAPECTSQPILGGNTTVTTSTAVNGLPWCIRSVSTFAADEFQVRGNSCSAESRPIRFALDVTGIGTCQYEKTTSTDPIKGTHTTSTTSSTLSIFEAGFFAVSGNPFGCPSSLWLDMTLQLKTDGISTTLGITS